MDEDTFFARLSEMDTIQAEDLRKLRFDYEMGNLPELSPKKRGGARPNSGRKPSTLEPRKVMTCMVLWDDLEKWRKVLQKRGWKL